MQDLTDHLELGLRYLKGANVPDAWELLMRELLLRNAPAIHSLALEQASITSVLLEAVQVLNLLNALLYAC